jgi:chromosome segregation ATPase
MSLASELINGLLPLGEPLVGAGVTLLTTLFAFVVGRRRSKQEVDNLQAEKRSIEAASGVSNAEAAQIISQAAAETVKPLLERLRELREENAELDQEILEKETQIRNLRIENEEIRTHAARLAVHNKLMKEKFRLQGDTPPELPPEVINYDSLF